jgi:acyl transferase domain-containing protein
MTTNALRTTPEVAWLYSGHGSQTFHMAERLYRANRRFKQWMDDLDAMLARRLGFSVVNELYDGQRTAADPLDNVLISHPAIFMVAYALSQLLIEDYGPADYLLGASLGELVAATVANALTLADALDLIADHAIRLSRRKDRGGMLAILDSPSLYHRWPELSCNCEIATLAGDSHFVVAGPAASLESVQHLLAQRRIDYLRLPIRYAFHSSHIDAVQPDIDRHPDIAFRTPEIPVVSCAIGALIRSYSPRHIWQTIREPMNLVGALDVLRAREPLLYVDVGPGALFAALLERRVERNGAVIPIFTPFRNECENLARLEAAMTRHRWPVRS